VVPLAESAAVANPVAALDKPVAIPEVIAEVAVEDACSHLEHELIRMHDHDALASALEAWRGNVADDACNQLQGSLLDIYASGELHATLAVAQAKTEELVEDACEKLHGCLMEIHKEGALEPTLQGTQTQALDVVDDACTRLQGCLIDLNAGDELEPAVRDTYDEVTAEVDQHCAQAQATLYKLAEVGGLTSILEVMTVPPERVDDMAHDMQLALLHLGETGALHETISAEVEDDRKLDNACLALQSELCTEFGSGVLWDVVLQHDSRKQAQQECLEDLCLDLLTCLEFCYSTPGIVEQILEDTIPVESHVDEIAEGDIISDSIYLPGFLGHLGMGMAIGEGFDPRLDPTNQTAPYEFPQVDEPSPVWPKRKRPTKRLYMASPKLGRLGIVDIDSLPPPRDRAPRRRVQNGPIRVAPMPQAWQQTAWKQPPNFEAPDSHIGRYYHLVYQGLSDLLEDLHLVKRDNDGRNEDVVVASVSADGPARRAGVAPGFLMGEVRGLTSADSVPLEDVLMGDRSLLLRPKEHAGLAVDLLCPADQSFCHGVPTVGDVAARVPWHQQSLFLPV